MTRRDAATGGQLDLSRAPSQLLARRRQHFRFAIHQHHHANPFHRLLLSGMWAGEWR